MKKRHPIKVVVDLTPQQADLIEDLCATGYFGENPKQTVAWLLGERLRDFVDFPVLIAEMRKKRKTKGGRRGN